MTTFIDTNINRAIEDSIREGETIVLTARANTQEWIWLVTGLDARATDWVPVAPSEDAVEAREYRGKDRDGDVWTIQAHAV